MKRSGAVFCYTHHPFQQYHRHYLQKELEKESNTSSNKKNPESAKHLHALMSVKQSSQGWRSVAIFFFCHIQKILNVHLPSIMLLTNTDPEGKKMLFQMSEMQRSQGVPDCSLCDILPISRNPLIIFSILLLTDMTQHIFWGTKISLFGVTVYPIILLFCVQHILKLSLKSVYQFFCNVVSKYGPKKYKNQDCSLSHIRPVLQISWKYIYPFFCNVANRHGFPRKK